MPTKKKKAIKRPLSGKKKLGFIGESAAIVYLKSKGHEILGRNICLKRGEVDILTKKDTTLHVVEVKTAIMGDGTGNPIAPEESFSLKKINHLAFLAKEIVSRYEQHMRSNNSAIQIDGVAIRLFTSATGKIMKITARYYPAISI